MNSCVQSVLVPDEDSLEQAFERVRPELEAFAGDLSPINVDIMSAVATALGVLPKLRVLEPQLREELPRVNPLLFERLQDYALAMAYAHAAHLVVTRPANTLSPLAEEAYALRDVLVADTKCLRARSLIDERALRSLSGLVGYQNVAQDLLLLATLFRSRWPEIAGRIPTTEAELGRAIRLASALLRGVGLRARGPRAIAESTALRAKAYTLFLCAYQESRRVVGYLRFSQGDAASIIPSFWAKRRRRRRKPEGDEPELADVPRPTDQNHAPEGRHLALVPSPEERHQQEPPHLQEPTAHAST